MSHDLDISTLIWYWHHPEMILLLLGVLVGGISAQKIFGGPFTGWR